MENRKLHLFQGYGVELEYMLVNRQTLNVLPICDQLIYAITGQYLNECELGEIALSNELMMHVAELKCNGPSPSLLNLPTLFQEQVNYLNQLLAKFDAMLLPTGAHPWMNPDLEAKIWPHEYNEIYRSYNRIFDCRGHGWSNLQSTHLNLPFANDDEFAKLHTATRLILPIIPALSASTPVIDSKVTGIKNTRLEYYRTNQKNIPSITGKVIPEVVLTEQEYQNKILKRNYQDIAPYDTENVLQEEWLNSRGAIARFERSAIEIRIVDIQECPQADLAILALIVAALKLIMQETWQPFTDQLQYSENDLLPIFIESIHKGQQASVSWKSYLEAFGYKQPVATMQQLWQHIYQQVIERNLLEDTWQPALNIILQQGNLSERILKAIGENPSHEQLFNAYKQLGDCLAQGKLFTPPPKKNITSSFSQSATSDPSPLVGEG